jgi:hypothetical protein
LVRFRQPLPKRIDVDNNFLPSLILGAITGLAHGVVVVVFVAYRRATRRKKMAIPSDCPIGS